MKKSTYKKYQEKKMSFWFVLEIAPILWFFYE